MLTPKYLKRTNLNTPFMEIEPQEGLMLIFTGNLRHGVKVSDIDE